MSRGKKKRNRKTRGGKGKEKRGWRMEGRKERG